MARALDNERTAAAENALRALASAAAAVRLYPPSSPMREDAVHRATDALRAMVPGEPVRLAVDRERFLLDGVPVGEGRQATAALAESLHALQVGQLIVGPHVSAAEVGALLDLLARDAREVRMGGGARAALVAAGAQNIAVVEVSLRASEEKGLAGVDLVAAPLSDIAPLLPGACEQWRRSAGTDDPVDEVARTLQGVEPAMRDLALARIAQSLLLLDEDTRIRLLQDALSRTPDGRPMDGMLSALAKLPPAALARLLRLTAEQRNTRPDVLLHEVPLPPDVLREIKALVQPIPQADPVRGVPEQVDPAAIAAEAETDEADQISIEGLVRAATPAAAAERALDACIDVFTRHADAESLAALAEAASRTLRAGTSGRLDEAAALIAQSAATPDLATEASAAARRLAREILDAAARLEGDRRAPLVAAAMRLTEQVAATASSDIGGDDERRALAAVELLLAMGDKRLTGIAARGLQHRSATVRLGTLRALAENATQEAATAIVSAVQRGDEQTRLAAVREVCRANLVDAMPALVRVLAEEAPLRRNHELKLEILRCIAQTRYAPARDAVARIAARRPVLRRTRELVQRAREALTAIDHGTTAEGSDPRE